MRIAPACFRPVNATGQSIKSERGFEWHMRGIYYQTVSGNEYFYNNDDGFIYPKKCIPHIKDMKTETDSMEVSGETVKQQLKGIGFRELILEMSQACNFRCRYCCYGEHYKNTRNHGSTLMGFETAKKAVDFYIKNFELYGKGSNIWRNPVIAFYGGEPLFNFKVIRQVVEYVKEKYPEYETEYTLTTNAGLLYEDVMDFLVQNDFAIIVSFDGNKENHDRNRVDVDGGGTFDMVYGRICRFREKYPRYMKFGISLCYDYRTDLFELEKFFDAEDLFVVSSSIISPTDTDYYGQFTKEERENFYDQYGTLKRKYLTLAKNKEISLEYKGILMTLFAWTYLEFSNHAVLNQRRPVGFPYSGCCVPGEKVYVTLDGRIHICEKMNTKFSIGNIEDGLDFEKIAEIEGIINKNKEKCSKCGFSKLCSICFSQMVNGDKLEFPADYCRNRRDTVTAVLKEYTEIMEESPENFDRFVSGYFSELHSITGGIVD